MGVEPTIFTLQKWCIANYATAPFKNLTPIHSISQIKKQKLDDRDLRIYEDFTGRSIFRSSPTALCAQKP